jgi:hypothetical protein
MRADDLSALLNNELGETVSYQFEAGTRAVAGSPAVLVHGSYAVAVHSDADGYRLSFWWNDREQAHGWSTSVALVARAADSWVQGIGLERLSADYPFVKFSELQLAYERGQAKEFQWNALLNGPGEAYRELVEIASRDSVLSKLFPQLGHRFVLSRSEYSEDVLASIFLVRPGWFVIFRRNGEGVEFEGDAQAMVSYLSNRLR